MTTTPHPGLEIALEGLVGPTGIAHRPRTHEVVDPHYRDGRLMTKNLWPPVADCSGSNTVRSFSWGVAEQAGTPLCATCYPEASR